ncbi:hypothetical protein M8818_003100 [Zalaria obscura]|uniref:Uncharacterized protein n=1 Tax=Zalaria obscura TaxID=2024903 RepID=A0ACC3SG01_9PEZI
MDRRMLFLFVLIPFITAISWARAFGQASWLSAYLPADIASSLRLPGVDTTDDWNILYHLGGNGPWIRKEDNIISNDMEPPPGCTVDQIHMVGSSVQTLLFLF